MDASMPESLPEEAWPLLPGDLPSRRAVRAEPRLAELEQNGFFRAMLKCVRSPDRRWGTEFFSPLFLIVILGTAISMALFAFSHLALKILFSPWGIQRIGLLFGSPAFSYLLQFLVFCPVLVVGGSLIYALIFQIHPRGQLAGMGVSETFLRGLTGVPGATRSITLGWWGFATGRRRLRFLRVMCGGILSLIWATTLLSMPLTPDYYYFSVTPHGLDFISHPLISTLFGFSLTTLLVGTSLGPHAMLLGVRDNSCPWKRAYTLILHPLDAVFGLAVRPGDLLFTLSIPLGLSAAQFRGAVISAASAPSAPAPSLSYAVLMSPLTPLLLSSLAGLYFGWKASAHCRRNVDGLLREIDENFAVYLEPWMEDPTVSLRPEVETRNRRPEDRSGVPGRKHR